MNEPVLELRAFGVAYGTRKVLRDVSFAVPPQGCTVLLGPSGTGKSTLLRTIAGHTLLQPQVETWGEARYRGAACEGDNRPALVLQRFRLLISDVLENLVCELPARSQLTQREQIALIGPQLEALGVGHLLQHLRSKVVDLPVTDQRAIPVLREAIARPGLLMLDEPTAGLPPEHAGVLLGLLRRLAQQRPLLLVLHNLREAREVGDHVILLANGRVQEAQPTADFFANPLSEAGQVFVRTGSCPEQSEDERAAAEGAGDERAAGGAEAVAEPEPEALLRPHTPAADGSAAVAVAPSTPAQPAALSAARGPRGFVWLLPGQLAGTPWPGVVHGPAYDLQALRGVGITHLISLTEAPFDEALAAGHGIARLSYPMPDMHPPTVDQALALCREIDGLLAGGGVVAVHCKAGLGRTGTVLASYWLWRGRGTIGGVKALEDVRRLEPGWVQSDSQVKFLEEFATVLAQTRPWERTASAPG